MTHTRVDNGQDTMDSQDVIERLGELRDERAAAPDDTDLAEELADLEALVDEAKP